MDVMNDDSLMNHIKFVREKSGVGKNWERI